MTEKFFFNGQAAAYANTRKCKTLGQKAALIQLAACCNQETLACFPSQELLAGRMCIKPRQLRTHLSGLEEADLIRRTARGNKEGGRGTDGYIIVGLREFFEDFKDNADRAYERGRSKPREDDTFRQKTASNPNRQKTAAKVGGLPAENCQGNRQKTADIKEKGKRKVLKENPLTPKGEASDAIASPAVCASPSQENEKESAKGTEPKKKGTIKPKREIPPALPKIRGLPTIGRSQPIGSRRWPHTSA
jgi:hypothetical protein